MNLIPLEWFFVYTQENGNQSNYFCKIVISGDTNFKLDTNRTQSSSFKTRKRSSSVKYKSAIFWEIKIEHRIHRTELILLYDENSKSF